MGQYLALFKYQHKLFCLVDKSWNLDFYFDSAENTTARAQNICNIIYFFSNYLKIVLI